MLSLGEMQRKVVWLCRHLVTVALHTRFKNDVDPDSPTVPRACLDELGA